MDLNNRIIGPVLPPNMQDKNNVSKDAASSQSDLYGPALPPNYEKERDKKNQSDSDEKIIGPVLPSKFSTREMSDSSQEDDEEDDDDEIIGPVPCTNDDIDHVARIEREFQSRADKMKDKLTGKEVKEETKREEWMLSLPPEMSKNFGLGPRTFNRKNPIEGGDKSVWTDTPADKEKKEKEMLEGKVEPKKETISKSVYDEEMEKRVRTHDVSKNKQESLVDLHRKELKRKAKSEDKKANERRPFDRDVDLQANKFDAAQRDAAIKKSRQLHSRFGSGEAKFL